jgi:hypothetical protein
MCSRRCIHISAEALDMITNIWPNDGEIQKTSNETTIRAGVW